MEIEKFNEYQHEVEIIFTNKRNPNLKLNIFKSRDGRIVRIDNPRNIRFPFSIGQILNRSIENWACNNNFLMDGKDMCPEKKLFGIKTKDIPRGHELRILYPHKFK